MLGTKTQNLIEAKVETYGAEGGTLHHSFRLVVPALDRYTYELFSISHSVLEPYPIVLPSRIVLENEDKFKDWLPKKLSSPETKEILGNLISQARS